MRIAGLLVLIFAAACGGGPAGKIMADTPVLPYRAPDIDEITGIDPEAEEDADADAGAASAAEAPAIAPASSSTPATTPTPSPRK
ncbi:MAG: hypothetical protein AB7P03_20010 [Kofleriaceae bacterium]